MNKSPEIIRNKATGDSIEFIQTEKETNGRISEFIMTLSPHSSWAKSPKHFHPFQTETFKVISGELNLNVGKQHFVLTPDQNKVTVDKFVPHSFWNATNEKVKLGSSGWFKMANVRFWDKALDAAEIAPNISTIYPQGTPNLISQYVQYDNYTAGLVDNIGSNDGIRNATPIFSNDPCFVQFTQEPQDAQLPILQQQ